MSIMVFTGAGASAFVNPKQFLTTVDFYNNLEGATKINIDSVASGALGSYISSIRKKKADVNIEDVLSAIDDMKDDLEGAVLTEDSLYHVFMALSGQGSIDAANQWREPLSLLEDRIRRKVYDLYGKTNFNREEMAKIDELADFINRLQNISSPVELFTTNYDNILDYIVRNSPVNVNDCKKIDESSMSITLDYPKPGDLINGIGRLTKLHGSTNWHINAGRIVVTGTPYFTGDHDRHLIVYPGSKDPTFRGGGSSKKYVRRYSIAAHDHLEKVASKAKAAVFIGYAFGDDYINSVLGFKDGIPKFIINKDSKALDSIPFPEETCQYTDMGLSDVSMLKCLQYIDKTIKV